MTRTERLTAAAMLLTGLFAIHRAEAVGTALTLASGALAAALFYWGSVPTSRLPRMNLLLILLFGFSLADLSISGDLLGATARFSIFLALVKFATLASARDLLQICLIVFLQLLAAAAATTDPVFGLAFILYLFLSLWALVLYHFRSEAEESGGTVPRIPAAAAAAFQGVGLASLGFTLFTFLIIPRIGVGLFAAKERATQRLSGFSERVDLGSIGSIKLDPTVVLRREVVQSRPSGGLVLGPGFYLKGMAFDRYDGKAWSVSDQRKDQLARRGTFFGLPSPGRIRAARQFEEQILLDPLDTEVLFSAGIPLAIDAPVPYLTVDREGSLGFGRVFGRRIVYRVRGESPLLRGEELGWEGDDSPDDIRERYLSGEIDPRIARLAEEIVGQRRSVADRAEAIADYLRKNFRYSLDVPEPSESGPIIDFLFSHKTGYCEYYATAMVLLLRSQGIASRLVTGFLPGEWNPVGEFFTVRQSDAHAWVEVYFPESGWIPYDPTPSVPAVPPTFFAPLRWSADWLAVKWHRYIVNYSLFDQIRLLEGARFSLAQPFTFGIRKFRVHPNARWFMIAILLAAVATAISILRGGWLAAEPAEVRLYRRMLRSLARFGVERSNNEGPVEFLKRLSEVQRISKNALAEATRCTEAYCRARFGGAPLKKEIGTMTSALAELKRTLRSVRTF